jgi:hypothetical protein
MGAANLSVLHATGIRTTNEQTKQGNLIQQNPFGGLCNVMQYDVQCGTSGSPSYVPTG